MRALLLLIGLSIPATAVGQDVEVDAPSVILKGIGLTVTVRSPRSLDSMPVVLRTADGKVLASAVLAPLGEIAFHDIVIEQRAQLPMLLVAGAHEETITGPFIPGWFSLLPPLVAIVLALVIHEVVSSLFVGVWLGCMVLVGYNPLKAVFMVIDRFVAPALANPDHAAIVIFSLLLGGMVGVMTRMGGTQAIVETVTPLATTPRRGQLATWLAGLGIFFDDYANTLLVGNTMRPLTDRLKVSREKLAYIVDSTAAPVAAIAFVSTWVGYEISLISDGLKLAAQQPSTNPALVQQLTDASPFGVFIQSIPYLFYPILAVFAVAVFALSRRDFGPMLKAEQRAARGGGVYRPGAQLTADLDSELGKVPDGVPLKWWNGVIPVLVVVATVVGGLIWTGAEGLEAEGVTGFGPTARYVLNNADPFKTLLWGSLLGSIAAIVLATGGRILSLGETIKAWTAGMRAMILAMIILILAWSLGEVTNALSTGSFLSGILSERLPLEMLPVTVFVVAAAMAFATGTSWATMAILFPLLVPLAVALGGNLSGGAATGAFLGSIASVLAGAIFGDHCSPISDTTVLSSMASGCDHLDHVRTQLPYALLVAGIAGVALLVLHTVFDGSPWAAVVMLAIGVGGIYAVVRVFGRRVDRTVGQ